MLRVVRCNWDQARWAAELAGYDERTVYQSAAWLRFIQRSQKAEPVIAAILDQNDMVGVFCGELISRCGVRILGSPFPGWTTAYMGLCLKPNISRREAVQAVIAFAMEELQCMHVEVLDRHLSVHEAVQLGLPYTVYRGFEIDLTHSEERLLSQMTSACRRCLRAGRERGVVVEEANDALFADDYWTQLSEVFGRQGRVPTYGVERVRMLIEDLQATGMLLLLRAHDGDGHCIATGIFPAMNKTMYFWGGASRSEYHILRPNEALHWYAMRYWKQRGIRSYDMGGAGEYKRKYGGTDIAVPWIRASKHRWVSYGRDLANGFVRWRQRLRSSTAQRNGGH